MRKLPKLIRDTPEGKEFQEALDHYEGVKKWARLEVSRCFEVEDARISNAKTEMYNEMIDLEKDEFERKSKELSRRFANRFLYDGGFSAGTDTDFY